MIWIIAALMVLISCALSYQLTKSFGLTVITFFIAAALAMAVNAIAIGIDTKTQTTAIETWSGTVTCVFHKEEWDEWHPPEERTRQVPDGEDEDGNTKYKTEKYTVPGYWEHYNAFNSIETSDGGSFLISKLPDGMYADDYYVNTDEELAAYYPIGSPSASIHTFENRVQTSYSVFRTNNVDETQYRGLPEYITTTQNYIDVNRFIGFNSNGEANKLLSVKNSLLNEYIPDPEKEGKMRSWKQVNLVFVNLGIDKTPDWGFALENYWQRGAKNDFIVALSTDNQGKVLWCYPISWSESELCKVEVRNHVTGMILAGEDDYLQMVEKVSDIVADQFVRKQFADFSYIKVNLSTKAVVTVSIIFAVLLVIWVLILKTSEWATDLRERVQRSAMHWR